MELSPIESTDTMPLFTHALHSKASSGEWNQRTLLLLTATTRPIDHMIKSQMLPIMIIACQIEGLGTTGKAIKVLKICGLPIEIPVKSTHYFFYYGIKDLALNPHSTACGIKSPPKKYKTYYLVRHLREKKGKTVPWSKITRDSSYLSKMTEEDFNCLYEQWYPEHRKRHFCFKSANIGKFWRRQWFLVDVINDVLGTSSREYNSSACIDQSIDLTIYGR